VIVVPDGPLSTLPFELLVSPASGNALVETSDLFYLPAARFLAPAKNEAIRQWRAPWRRQLVAFGGPPVSSTDTLATAEQWRPLPASADEVESIARIVPGRAEIHLGADARKRDLMGHSLQGISLLHFSTHAVVDSENPDRSRILMAPDAPSSPNDYLFQQEVYGLDLKGVDLVTVSACDTAHGKDVRGDGIQAFSRAFLAAGAAATVTSLWRVADRPTSEFMKQFYYFLARGETKSQALRSAKLQFLHSASSWSAPRYWAAFLLNGQGETPCARVLPWGVILALAAVVLLAWGSQSWLQPPFRRLFLRRTRLTKH
jgi:CHAT domain-containing protein